MTSKEIRINIATNLKFLLDQKDWSAADLSRESGVGQMTISGILSGKHCPRVDILKRLADALFVSMDNLATELSSAK